MQEGGAHHILLMLGGVPYRDLVDSGAEVPGYSWCGSLAKKVTTDKCAIFSMAAEEMRTVMEVVDEKKQVERQECWRKKKWGRRRYKRR